MWLFLGDSEPSKIFVGDTPISKVFLWDTQVRPSGWAIWTYSYDFTTWSTSDLQSKWWTVPTGSVVNSNGYYNSSRNWNAMTLADNDLATACQNAKKFIFSFTWSATGTHQRAVWLRNVSTEIVIFYWDGVAHTWGNQALFWWEHLFNESTLYGNNWTYTATMTVDIVNKTWQVEMTDHTTLTWTITDTAIATFRNCEFISVYWERYAYVKSFSVTIE